MAPFCNLTQAYKETTSDNCSIQVGAGADGKKGTSTYNFTLQTSSASATCE